MCKKSTLVKISSVWCFFKLTRPVYYQLHLNMIKTSLKTIFLLKKSYFCIFNKKKKKRGLKDSFSERPLNVCPLNCTYIGKK